jgi:PAS domain S-box-containing protein
VSDHLVQFYEDEQHLSEVAANFLGAGLAGNDHLLIIATEPHRKAFREKLESKGFDVEAATKSERLALLDARETLARFMRNGEPDPRLFEAEVGQLIARKTAALSGSAHLRAYGEMVDLLWHDGQRDAAIRLEELWNELQQRHRFTLLCAYAMASFYSEPTARDRVERTHTHQLQASPREEIERALRHSLREVRAKEDALRESQKVLQLVTDALPTLVTFVDSQQRYRFMNAAYERWFGHPRAEVLGKHLEEVLGAEAYQVVKPHAERALGGTTVTYEAQLPYRDAGLRWVQATYIPQRESSGEVSGFIGLVADISERKRQEAFSAIGVERAGRLLKITSAIADAVTDAQVFQAVVDDIAAAVDASSVGLWLIDEKVSTANLVRSVGYSEGAQKTLSSVAVEPGRLPVIDALHSRAPVWISSQAELLERYPHLKGTVTAGRAYRVACLPIVAQGLLLGALGVTFEADHPPQQDEREFLLLAAGYASQAIERLRLLELEKRSRAEANAAVVRLGVLNQASRAFVETELDLESRLRGVVSTLGTMTSGAIGISLIGPDGRLETTSTYHPNPEAQEFLQELGKAHRLSLDEGISGAAIRAGRSLHLPSLEPAELMARVAPAYRGFVERFPIYAMICVPLRVSGRIIGVVLAARVRKGERYTTDDLELIAQLAERSAAAIDNSRLYEETAQARSRSDQLYRFAQAVMNAESVEKVLDAALDAIEAALSTQRAAVLTYGGEPKMRFRRWRNLSDEYRAAVEGHSPWTADTVSPEAVVVPDALADASLASYGPLFAREGIGALAFIPLVTAGRLIGKFMVYFSGPRRLSRHELELVQAISNHLASVITRFEASAKLEETVRANELFAGVLAHDLRNPLGAMLNAAQLIEMRREGQSEEDDRERKPLSRISSSGQRMMTMIEQLLDFTRARSGGGIELICEQTDLAHLCTEALGELELSHPEAKVRTEIVGDQRGIWDPDRLLQVFSNVLSNAAQHGVVEKGISLKLDGTAADQIRVDIHNAGAIPPTLMKDLFDPFRGTTHGRARSRGLGLGLFIVREIVRAHGGSVDVASTEAEGTTFSVQLPRQAPRRSQKGGR